MAGHRSTSQHEVDGEAKDKSGLGLLVAVIASCATVFTFWTNYGEITIGAIIAICSFLALFRLLKAEPFGVFVRRDHPKVSIAFFCTLLAGGVALCVFGYFHTYSAIDFLRPEFGAKSIAQKSYKNSTAIWASLPNGTVGGAKTAFDLAGWKRLMGDAVTNDPQNANQSVRQLFYIESSSFDRSYRGFNAELELPTSVEIIHCYSFLVRESAPRSSHEQLESMRADYPLGVDRNKANILVASPDAGERLIVFVVASSKNNRAIPNDIESTFSLRSIR